MCIYIQQRCVNKINCKLTCINLINKFDCINFFLTGGHLNSCMRKAWSIEDSRCCQYCLSKVIALIYHFFLRTLWKEPEISRAPNHGPKLMFFFRSQLPTNPTFWSPDHNNYYFWLPNFYHSFSLLNICDTVECYVISAMVLSFTCGINNNYQYSNNTHTHNN